MELFIFLFIIIILFIFLIISFPSVWFLFWDFSGGGGSALGLVFFFWSTVAGG